jgi:site-specific recombinase XerD
VPVPNWVKAAIDRWTTAAKVESGYLFRCVTKYGTVWGNSITEKVIWHVVRKYARLSELGNIAPHDLRRTCARLCHEAGGELEQIQFLLGHLSVQTTEQYLGCKQRFRSAVNHHIGIELDED